MNGADITVVIPTYRRPKLLARALLSVVQQGVPGLCIRVCDNASGDETELVVREFSRRHPIEYVRHEENMGCSANMEFAINSVTTPHCCILNDDDMHLPGLLSSALEILGAHPTVGAVCGRTLVYHESDTGGLLGVRTQGTTWEPGAYRAGQATMRMVREHFTPTAVVFATAALRGAKFTFGDMEMMARIAEQGDFAVSDRILGVYVVHPFAWSASHSLEEHRQVTFRRLKEYLELQTLTQGERLEVVSKTMTELMSEQFWRAHNAMAGGERTSAVRRDLAISASMLGALMLGRADLATRFHLAAAARITGSREAPLSRAEVLALRGARKVSGAVHRLTAPPNRVTAAEQVALTQVAALKRSAEAFFAQVVAS